RGGRLHRHHRPGLGSGRLRWRHLPVPADGGRPVRLLRPLLVAGPGAGHDEYLPGLERPGEQLAGRLAQPRHRVPERQVIGPTRTTRGNRMKPGFCAQLALTVAACAGAWTAQAGESATGPALKPGHEYLIVTNYPNNLHVVDVASDTVYKSCRMPDAFGPGTAMMAPDNRTAYVLNNHYADLYGIDLDTCQATFHANLSSVPGEVARSMYSFAISPDGKEIYATVNPTQRLNDHYVVKPP